MNIDPDKVIIKEPLMIRDGGGLEWIAILIPLAVLLFSIIMIYGN